MFLTHITYCFEKFLTDKGVGLCKIYRTSKNGIFFIFVQFLTKYKNFFVYDVTLCETKYLIHTRALPQET